jgi:CheY-like chemotaxis protein
MMPAAEAKEIAIQMQVDPRAGPISGDPARLQQIVWNLVSNAVKFTPRFGRIDVQLDRADSSVRIVVSDTGIGIKPEFLPHLFERFRQGDAGSTRENPGLGLGLAIVRHLVELHGGSVSASSQGEGRGARFEVRLPIIAQAAMTPDQDLRQRGRRQPVLVSSPTRLSGIHVLAIDDDADALNLVREILQSAGARVTTAEDAIIALDRIEAVQPDVIVADIGLPHMDGFEFIERVRQLSDRKVAGTPAAALTAYARSEDRIRALETGFQMHLAKPIDPVELIAAVAVLARRSVTR